METILVLAYLAAFFGVFAVTLGWVAWYSPGLTATAR
jgi:hypothetical protein